MTKTTLILQAKNWNEWARQAVKFVRASSKGDDEPLLRSKYILLSWALELMLKSRLVAIDAVTEQDLINYGHDIRKILKRLKTLDDLKNINIQSLPEEVGPNVFCIKTTDAESFYYHNFTDIRYSLKPIKQAWDTEKTILNTTKKLLEIVDKVHNLWKQPPA